MKLLYYNIFIYKNGQKTNYPINQLLDFINVGQPLQRTAIVDGKTIFLSKHRYPQQNRNNNGSSMEGYEYEHGNRTVWIGKFLEDKPYAGQIGSDNLNEIVGDVYQPNTCLFVSEAHLLIMEYNFNGPKRLQIEQFLSNYLNQVGEDIYTVKLIQLTKQRSLNLLHATNSINNISITVKNSDFQLANLFPNAGMEITSVLEKLFNGPIEVSNEFDVNQTTVVLKKGRMKQNMKIPDVARILMLLNSDSDFLVSAKVEFKNPQTNKKDVIDLKHDAFYTSNIEDIQDLTGFDYLANEITRHYYDTQGRNKNREYLQYISEINQIDRNEITFRYPEGVALEASS